MTDTLSDRIHSAYSPQSIDDLWMQQPVIDQILAQLQQRPLVTVIGTPCSGRSSVIKIIQKRLSSLSVPLVTFSIQTLGNMNDAQGFFQAMMEESRQQIGDRVITLPRELQDVRKFFHDLTKEKPLYMLVDHFGQLQGRSCEQTVLNTFRSLYDLQNLHIAFAGDLYPCGEDMSKDFPFAELAPTISLNQYIPEATLIQYIRQFENFGLPCSTTVADDILEMTGGEPVLIQHICREIATLLSGSEVQWRVADMIKRAVQEVINTAGNDLFHEQWLSLTFAEQQVLLVMKALPSPYRIREELQSLTRLLVDVPDTGLDIDPSQVLDLLARRCIVKKENRKYSFANHLFMNWLPKVTNDTLLLGLLREFAALARTASYSSEIEGWAVAASLPSEKHNKRKLSEDLRLLARGKPLTRPVILHISDTQFCKKGHAFTLTGPNDPQSLCYQLKRALRKCRDDHGLPLPNAVVISGDIANHAWPSEYDHASEFIKALRDFLDIDAQHVVLVPGNHDINFKLSQSSFLKTGNEESYEPDTNWSDKEEHYPLRFVPFQRFFETVYSGTMEYSLNLEKMYCIYPFPDWDLLIVGFNSCIHVDHRVSHLESRQGYISEEAIENARSEIEKKYGDRYKLVIAVWHHNPIHIAGAADLLANGDKVPEVLGARCQLALYGHIHQPHFIQSLPGTLQSTNLRCIGAGAIGVEQKHRGGTEREGQWPLSFNLIELDLNSRPIKGRLYTFDAHVSGSEASKTFHWRSFPWNGDKLWRDFELG